VGSGAHGDVGVGSWIERRARVDPDRPAIIAGDQSISYRRLAERIRRLAGGLDRLGVARGDRVAWLGPNHPAFLEALFAAGSLGAVLAPVNHRLGPEERALVLDDAEPVVVIEHHAMAPTRAPASVRHRLVVGEGAANGALDYESFVAGSPDDPIGRAISLDDLLFLPHTSGTTGSPKGVMLSHGNVTWNVVNLLSRAEFRGDDVTMAIAPFFRVGGTGVNVMPVLFLGGTVVVPDDMSGDGLLRLVERHRVTVGFGNPDVLDEMVRAERWHAADLSSLRFILTGGAPVPERLIQAYHDRGVALVQGYGLSEAGPVVLLLDAEQSLRKIGSAGRPPLLVDIRILDPDGHDVDPGQTGELVTRGPNVMAGYWRRPAETGEVLTADGWLRTGDAARVDPEGDVRIVDRVAAGFVVDGRTVYPGDVERQLMTHPAVADAGVAGVMTAEGQVAGAAFVVLLPASRVADTELLEFVRGRLEPHELPASITFLDRLPRSSVGKLLRADLQAIRRTAPGS
jgi:acyl-CoA synthetase (AMP-forming)/AMP-acid ligase II